MSGIILKVDNISKQYRLGLVGSGTLRDDFKRFVARVRGKEDPFLKVGSVNDRSMRSDSDYVWALQDINFEVKRGEVLGIIGKNGAGKSTLLKILSRVTAPTTGTIKSKGRIASLLEVGTGFNPELTGRENIYLNGAILGMTRAEITSKLDEIIDFSGCERYIDTPTKRYSSGMTVRLAFAVAAHLEPEILVVDEVLAVGDAEFQKKAIGKMQDISSGAGRTVLFVSHNMGSVQQLCTRAIVLDNGNTAFEGTTTAAVRYYLDQKKENHNTLIYRSLSENNLLQEVYVETPNNSGLIVTGKRLAFNFKISKKNTERFNIKIGIYDQSETKVIHLSSAYSAHGFLMKNKSLYTCELEKNPLPTGSYYVNIAVQLEKEQVEHVRYCLSFTVLNGDYYDVGKLIDNFSSKVLVEQAWRQA
ncbi:MAG TPA: ATP-binding cassette domain-containing protein [Leeuwenhoekiella sp.]|nr:ATP-binding cassette domain-containing protein [Leeuwenhoekiella sp.]